MVMLMLVFGLLSALFAIVAASEDESSLCAVCMVLAIACLLPPALIENRKVEHISTITTRLELRDVAIVADTPKVFSYDKITYSNFSYKWLTTPSGGKISDIKVEDYDDKNAK